MPGSLIQLRTIPSMTDFPCPDPTRSSHTLQLSVRIVMETTPTISMRFKQESLDIKGLDAYVKPTMHPDQVRFSLIEATPHTSYSSRPQSVVSGCDPYQWRRYLRAVPFYEVDVQIEHD